MCRTPTSYLKPCASEAQSRFHFMHCADAAYTFHRGTNIFFSCGHRIWIVDPFWPQSWFYIAQVFNCFLLKYNITNYICTVYYYSIDAEVDLECLGDWREGTEHYMYGRLKGPGFHHKNDMYRCFVSIMELLYIWKWKSPVAQGMQQLYLYIFVATLLYTLDTTAPLWWGILCSYYHKSLFWVTFYSFNSH